MRQRPDWRDDDYSELPEAQEKPDLYAETRR